jgi:NTP pyrophosphatase (non-canonical NTP hydrolase)
MLIRVTVCGSFVCYTSLMADIQKQIADYLDERGWNNLQPSDLAKSVMIEGAELLELFQWKNFTVDEINKDPELKLKIQKEMADVMIYCTELAIHLDIDVEEAMKKKLEHNAKKYPAEEIKKSRNDKASDSYYMKRKMEYRKTGK